MWKFIKYGSSDAIIYGNSRDLNIFYWTSINMISISKIKFRPIIVRNQENNIRYSIR